jgi:type II secretory pathway pseudopilin PulG
VSPTAARRTAGRPASGRRSGAGWSLPELLAALALAAAATLLAAPALARTVRREALEGAIRTVSADLSRARWEALAGGEAVGLRFTLGPQGDLTWSLCRDGDGDGLRSADIAAGIDRCTSRPPGVRARFNGVHAGVPAGRVVPKLPPQSGPLDNPADPVKFGTADVTTFSPLGNATAGSLYLTDGTGAAALVVNGTTGRLRLFRLHPNQSAWKEIS